MADLILGLYDTNTDTLLAALSDGLTVPFASLTSKTTLVVGIDPASPIAAQVKSVRITLTDGTTTYTRLDNTVPFTLFGDSGTDLRNGVALPAGDYQVLVEVYSLTNGKGVLLESSGLDFAITTSAPPVAAPDSATVLEDKSVVIDVLANDSDPDDTINPTTVKIVGADGSNGRQKTVAGEGVWKVNATTGAITFTPVANYDGPVTPISYTVVDQSGATSNPATVSVTITPVNDKPVAVADTATGPSNTVLVINVLANDRDVEDGTPDPTSVRLRNADNATQLVKTVAGQGVWRVDTVTGTISFTPVTGFVGTATAIQYTVADSAGLRSAAASVTATIVASNLPPVATADSATVAEDGTVVINVLANDVDPDGTLVATSVQIVGADDGTGKVKTVAGQGVWTVNATTGAISFTPEANYAGAVTPISYTVADNTGTRSAPATVAVAITPVNDVPVATADSAVVAEDGTVVVNVLANDIDIDGTLVATSVQIVGADDGTGKVKTVAGQGVWTVNATTGAISFTPEANYAGAVTPISYTVADNDGARSVPATVAVTITPVNDAPVAAADSGTVTENGTVVINVLANDVDIDGTLVATSVQIIGADDGTGKVKTVAGQGVWTVNATTGAISFTPEANYAGAVTPISYTVADNDGARSAPASVSVAVTAANDAPMAVGDTATVAEDSTVVINVLANDSDPDGSLVPGSVQIVGADDGTGKVKTVAGQGVWTVNATTGAISFTPEANYAGAVTPISYTVADNDGARSVPATVAVSITPVNDAPVAVADSATVAEDTSVVLNVLANDVDIDGTLVATSVQIVGADDGTGKVKTVAGQGVWMVNATTGAISFSPEANYAGAVTPISYTVADNDGARSAPSTVAVSVTPVNDAPVAVADSATVAEDSTVVINVLANDSDPDGSLVPGSVQIVGADDASGQVKTVAGQGFWSVNGSGTISFTPAANFNGTVTPIGYTVADNDGARSAPSTVGVTITPVNDAPVAVAHTAATTVGTAVALPVSVLLAGSSDVDGDSLTVTGVSGAVHGSVALDDKGDSNPANDVVIFTPAAGYSGAASFNYTLGDGHGGTATAAVTVQVAPAGPSQIILQENQKAGVAKSVWDAPISNQIEGFATDISVDTGDRIDFKINVNAALGVGVDYHIEIYRLGYYGGAGATLVTTIDNLTGFRQPDPITDSRGLVDAGNWSVSASWQTPETAVSGVYIARLVREGNGAENQIPFILREDDARADGSRSDIVFQTSDTTWQAYNGWGGLNGQVAGNFYGGFDQPDNLTSDPGLNPDRAFAVSYNRPFLTRDGGGAAAGAQDYLFGADYAAIYWLEQQGYDVSYISGVDADRLGPGALLGHKAYISVGHDEYWSGNQRANVEAARDAGVNLLFWSGNEVYWKTRYEASIDGSNTDYRTLVCYKETWANYSLEAGAANYANIDPSNEWTGTWRDLRFVDAVDANGVHTATGARPENSLTGQLFGPDGTGEFGGALDVPAALSGLRLWRDTAVESGGVIDLAPGLIGYEWNTSPEDANRPAGLIKLSETTLDWSGILTDQGNRVAPGTATHNLTIYRAESGALVFGAGTVFWSWALSNQHDGSPYDATIANTALQQFTMNLFADMGIQAAVADAVLASRGLVRAEATSDHVAATTTLNALPASVNALSPVTITGTATDNDGNPLTADGVIGVVEVSVDGGESWHVATGKGTWSYSWTPTTAGTYQVLARAIDDSLNTPSGSSVSQATVQVAPPQVPTSFSLFDPHQTVTGTSYNDGSAVELGLRFSADTAGAITALKYWRGASDAGDTDTRAGHLWDANGNLLATVTFTSTPGQTGWQVASLSTPVQISANTEYVVSYKTLDNYLAVGGFFTSAYAEPYGTLTAPGGQNGVYAYSSSLVFPSQSYQASNYWVDVSFAPETAPSPAVATSPSVGTMTAAGGFTSSNLFVVAPDQKVAGRVTVADPDDDTFHFSFAGGKDRGRLSIDHDTGEITFNDFPGRGNSGAALAEHAYHVVVRATDGEDTFTQKLTIQMGTGRDGHHHGPPGYVDPDSGTHLPGETPSVFDHDGFVF